jgi:hypothetical protein
LLTRRAKLGRYLTATRARVGDLLGKVCCFPADCVRVELGGHPVIRQPQQRENTRDSCCPLRPRRPRLLLVLLLVHWLYPLLPLASGCDLVLNLTAFVPLEIQRGVSVGNLFPQIGDVRAEFGQLSVMRPHDTFEFRTVTCFRAGLTPQEQHDNEHQCPGDPQLWR